MRVLEGRAAARPAFTMACVYWIVPLLAWASMRSRMAAIVSPASLSPRSAQLPRWSGENTRTSWTPLAVAWVNTGPSRVSRIGSSPSKAG